MFTYLFLCTIFLKVSPLYFKIFFYILYTIVNGHILFIHVLIFIWPRLLFLL